MSEQARIAALQEKIKNSRSVERSANFAGIAGAVLSGIGFGLYFNLSRVIGTQLLGVLGLIVMVLGLVGGQANKANTGKLIRELESIGAKIPTCPKCGGQIPQGNYTFCPFCGAELKTQ